MTRSILSCRIGREISTPIQKAICPRRRDVHEAGGYDETGAGEEIWLVSDRRGVLPRPWKNFYVLNGFPVFIRIAIETIFFL